MVNDRSDIQRAALFFGVVLLFVGIGGFIPGITTDYDRLTIFDDAGAKLLGLFGVNILENVAHLLLAVAGLALASSWAGAKDFLVWGGLIYVALWMYGLIIELDTGANFLGLNMAANWLHFLLGVVMVALAYLLTRRGAREPLATT